MRKLFIITVLSLLAAVGDAAAQSMRSIFVNAPDSVFPLLTRVNREDCIDFLNAGMRARVSNRLDGKSELRSITDDFLELCSSEYSTVQMRLLPFAGDTIIAVVRSVCAESCDSRISFYKKSWEPAAVSFVRPPISEFFISPDSAAQHLPKCDIYLVKLSLSATDETLVAEYTMPSYMSEDDAKVVSPCLRPLLFRWKGGAFVRE